MCKLLGGNRVLVLLGHPYFELIESFPIDSNDVCLCDECFGVYFVDNPEDRVALAALGHDEEHLHLMPRIEAMSLNDGSATVRKDCDPRGYLLIFVGDDKKLNAAVHDVHYLVYTVGCHDEHDISIDDLFEVVEHKIGRRDDDDIAHHDDAAKRYVAVLVHDSRDDICPPCGSVEGKTHAHATTAEDGTDEACHKRLVSEKVKTTRIAPGERRQRREQENGIDGLDTEAPS